MIKEIIVQKIINNFRDVSNIEDKFRKNINKFELSLELTNKENLLYLLNYLHKEPEIYCQQLIDLCAVDYLHYGVAEIHETKVSSNGFSRAVSDEYLNYNEQHFNMYKKSRFAIVYQLLSITNNLRLTLKCLLNNDLSLPSCIDIWPVANWYEREVFDMFGIEFIGHPNLTRILTEDHFTSHPFRKDFPLTGTSEVRFDGTEQKVIQQPIDIEHYPVVPKVIRNHIKYDLKNRFNNHDANSSIINNEE